MYFDDLNLKVWYRRHKVTRWEASTAKILIFVSLVVSQPTLPSTADVSSSTAAWAASSPQLSSGTTASGGLAGPTNNDVCLNGGGAALTLYTPCQFPPVRQPVNCCRHPLARISSRKLTGFLCLSSWFAACSDLLSEGNFRPVWHLSVSQGKLSSNLSNWTQTAEVPAPWDLGGFWQLSKTVAGGCQVTLSTVGDCCGERKFVLGVKIAAALGLSKGAPTDTWDLQLHLPPTRT